MKPPERLQRRVLARRKCQPLQIVSSALQMAMSGVMVTLLIIFMLETGSRLHGGFPLDRAGVKHATLMPGAKREDAISIFILRDGAVYFGHTAIRVADVADRVRQKVRDGSERRAYLMVDQRAKYGAVGTVVDAIRGGGIWNIGLLVDEDRRIDARP